jgi:antitoxin MazE
MPSALRKIGNSAGVTFPQAVLREAGLEIGVKLDFVAENGGIMVRPVAEHPRAGWAEDAARIAALPDDPDEVAWRAFGNEWDAEWTW